LWINVRFLPLVCPVFSTKFPAKINGGGGEQSFASVTVHQRTTNKVAPGGYTGTVYAYATGNGNTLSVTHCDTFALGNLS
jgi:hypothetical protein